MHNRSAIQAAVIMLSLTLAACSSDGFSPGPGDPPPLQNIQRWSDPATWPSHAVPLAGAAVVIPADRNVVLDVSPPPLTSLTIEGALVFGDVDLALTSGWIVVHGTLRAGTPTQPYTKHALITLTGSPDGADVMGMGNKVLGVMGGTLDLHGEPRLTWTHLASSASRGATGLTLAEATGWRAGDRIAIASTDFDPMLGEDAVIASAQANSVTLETPLRNPHYGQMQSVAGRSVDERAEVGLLTHNIVIRGDTGTQSGVGGHIMVMQGGTARVDGVELYLMGQRGQKARYPMHWHLSGPVDGQYFSRSSVWKSFNRCVTVHGTQNARVDHNVCYDHIGHGYFLEDGAETGNVLEANLGFLSRAPVVGQEVIASDSRPATFWITNPDNTVRGNVAGGSKGFGFWYALPAAPTGLSAGAGNLPRRTALREFSGNVAHSNRSTGLNVDDGPKTDGTTETTFYSPKQDAANPSALAAVADFHNFTAYKHGGRAVWLRGSDLRLTGAVLADNAIGATFAASETMVQDALFVGETDNRNSALPAGTPERGYEFYDGRVGAQRVTFANYSGAGSIPSGALGFNRNNGFPVSTANFAEALQFVNATPVYLETPHADKDGDKAAAFIDVTGSVTGTTGAYVVANTAIMLSPGCMLRPEWNAYVCTARVVGMSLGNAGAEPVAPVTIARDDNVTLALAGVPNNPKAAALSLVPGRKYTLQFAAGTPSQPKLYFNRTAEGDWLRVSFAFPAPGSTFKVVRDYDSSHPLVAAASLAELDASAGDRYFYDASAGVLHLKSVTRTGRDSATLFVTP